MKETIPDEYLNLRFIFQYRFLHSNGNYIILHTEKALFTIDGSAPLYYCIMKDITREVVFSGVKLEIYKQDSILEKIAEYRPGIDHVRLTKRERDIVELMQKGLSTKQIAFALHISQFTARNIKQKMFEKYKVNNAIAFLNKAVHLQ